MGFIKQVITKGSNITSEVPIHNDYVLTTVFIIEKLMKGNQWTLRYVFYKLRSCFQMYFTITVCMVNILCMQKALTD